MRADDRYPLAGHFSELRSRAIRSVLFFILATAVALAFHRLLLQALLLPAEDLNAFTDGKPIFTELTEFWGAALKVSLLAGLGLSLPFILFQVVRFAAPGLREQERRWLWFLIPGGLLAFASGVLFGYFVLIPPAINFLSTFGGEIATPIIRIGSYVNLVTSLLFWLGLVFELPLVIFFLAKIGVVTSSWLASKRKWAILLAFVAGAMITPTFDPVNQALVAGPIIVLYEAGYWLSRVATRGRSVPQVSGEEPLSG